MENSNTNNTPGVFLVGLVLGAVLTALFTPRNGEEMREVIKDNANHMKDTMRSTTKKAGDLAEDKLDDAKDMVSRGTDKIVKNIPADN